MKKICDYGETTYFLKDDSSVWCGINPDNLRLAYSKTPLKRGYAAFMAKPIANAFEANGLFKDD